MKVRVEKEGVHFYDRTTGIHLLMDEIDTSKAEPTRCPRTVSIAITNTCNLSCDYCHIEKGSSFLEKEFVFDLSKKFDELGAFDLAIGGGEPFLHPDLPEICKYIQYNTDLGLSITTNGTLLTRQKLSEIKDCVSLIRISVDGTSDIYEQNRDNKFKDIVTSIKLASSLTSVGINVVIKDDTLHDLDNIKNLYFEYGCAEILLLPLVTNGNIALSSSAIEQLRSWICENATSMNLRILAETKNILKIDYLFDYAKWEESYIHIDANKMIKRNSYSPGGKPIENINNISKQLETIMV